MNEWLSKMTGKLKDFWKSASVVKKVILLAVVAAVIIAVIVAARVSSAPATVRLFNAPVTNESTRDQILDRLSEENIQAFTDDAGYISVLDEKTARKMRSILISEGLTPSKWDPFADFYNRTWSTTDMEQNVKLKNAVTAKVQQQLEALDDIASANVTINLPENKLFTADQKPVSASIILKLRNGSDLDTNKKRQKNLQRLILTMVEGLTAENLTISDTAGTVLNDFEGMEDSTRLTNIEKEQKIRHQEEAKLKAAILSHLQTLANERRIGDLVVSLDMDMSKESSEATIYSPIVRKVDNPDTPYDDSEIVDTLPLSQQTVTKEWQGTGYNPEGPAGVEGQTPPVYSDMSNVIGKSVETGVTQNNVINTTVVKKEISPQIGRRSVSVNVDGKWTLLKDPKTHGYIVDEETGGLKRTYAAVPAEELAEYKKLVESAINYDKVRGDMVVVTNIQVDRTAEFEEFDNAYFKAQQTKRTILLSLIAVAVVLVGFILFRIISKEMERRRRAREEELLRQQQLAREQALWEAKDEAQTVTMSVEESRRAELQENAINMAKEHPEDVAMLIRTWLMEE
ncbi:MAG: flagellar M-ring protein FliF [Treponema sp.]|nr:flagellar M-ring protein FliF [Treponema sp.]